MKSALALLLLLIAATSAHASNENCEIALGSPREEYMRVVAQLATLQRNFNATQYIDPITGEERAINNPQIKEMENLWERATNFLYPLRLITHFGVDHLFEKPNTLLFGIVSRWSNAAAVPAPSISSEKLAQIATQAIKEIEEEQKTLPGSNLQWMLRSMGRFETTVRWTQKMHPASRELSKKMDEILDYLSYVPAPKKIKTLTLVGSFGMGGAGMGYLSHLTQHMLSSLYARKIPASDLLRTVAIKKNEVVAMTLHQGFPLERMFQHGSELENLILEADAHKSSFILVANGFDGWKPSQSVAFLRMLTRIALSTKTPGSLKVLLLQQKLHTMNTFSNLIHSSLVFPQKP